jgi:hypothetical protein
MLDNIKYSKIIDKIKEKKILNYYYYTAYIYKLKNFSLYILFIFY